LDELGVLLLQMLFEVLGPGLLELLWELAASSYKATYGRRNHNRFVAAVGYCLVGATLGGVSLLIWPKRLFGPGRIPGLSLLVSPVGGGVTMQAWGVYRRSRGHVTTNLATFLGGAAFAFGTALVRFLWAQ
jgi:hypothetical protein